MRSAFGKRAVSKALALLVGGLVASAAAARQRPVPGDQVELRGEIVELRAVVTDKSGRPRGDLKKEDFEVRENGAPREIAFFSVEHAGTGPEPAHPATPAPGAPPGASTDSTRPSTPRSVVFFVDAANMASGTVSRSKRAVCTFANARMANLGKASVVSSSGTLGLEGRFTTSSAELCAAVEKISPRPPSFAGGAFTPYLAAEIVRGSNPEALAAGAYLIREAEGIPPPLDADRPGGDPASRRLEILARQRSLEVLAEFAEQRRIALASLRLAVDQLARMPGQRLLLLVSDGFTLFDRGGERETAELEAVIARAVRSGVVISSLSGQGLESGMFTGADDPLYTVPPTVFAGYGLASRRDLEDGMTALAKDTGGEVYRNTNDFGGAIGKALDANAVYYVLAFYPEGDAGKSKTYDVRLTHRPELTVRAQRGLDPNPNAPLPATPVVQALASTTPSTDIGVAVRGDFEGPTSAGSEASIHVYVGADRLAYRTDGDRKAFDVEVATAVYDERGTAVDTKVEALAGTLAPRAYDLARANGFHVTRRVVLAPGRYEVRAAVREASTGHLGTARSTLEVPSAGDGRVLLGGLTLSGSHGADGPLFVPRSPKGLRTLLASDVLVYAASVSTPAAADRLQLRLSIAQGERVLYRSAWEPLASRAVEHRDGSVRFSGQLQLGATPSGVYTLRVEVRDGASGVPSMQSAEFRVER